MCGRYTIRRIDLLFRFGAMEAPGFDTFDEHPIVPRFNAAPSQDVPIVRINSKTERVIDLVRWGLIPSWTKGKPKLAPINARADLDFSSPNSFARAGQQRYSIANDSG